MAIEMKFVVTREGKEIGVFATQQEAEAFDAVTERSEKLELVLTATTTEHQLDMEAIKRVARSLAARDKELGSIFASAAKPKTKSIKGARAKAPAKKTKGPAAVRDEAEAA